MKKTYLQFIKNAFFIFLFILAPKHGFSEAKKVIETQIIDVNYENGHSMISNFGGAQPFGILFPEITLDENNFYLIRSGVKVWNKNSRESRILYSLPQNQPQTCKLENPDPNNNFTVGDNLISAIKKFNVLKKCFQFRVEDQQKGLIEYEESQKNCDIQRINESSVIISWGGDCFLKAKNNQQLRVEILSETKCNNRSYLVENNISPMEISGIIQTYLYPRKEIGVFFEPKKTLWDKAVLMNLNSGKELLSNTEMEGNEDNVLTRPDHYILPDFIVTDLGISNENGKMAKIDLKFLLNTMGAKDSCNDGLCSNYLNYDVPFVPFLVLRELNSRTRNGIELQSTFIGDRIPSNWNGEFSSKKYFQDFQFEAGKKYSIELIFSDPTSSYQELKNLIKSLFKLEGLRLGNTRGRTSIATLGGMGGISGMGTMGAMGGFGGVSFDNISGGLGGMGTLGDIPRIAETINDPTFPPQYTKVCNKSLSVCNKSSIKEQQKVTINFEVKSIEGPNVILGDDISIEQSGNLYQSYKGKLDLKNKPTIKCSNK